MKKKLTQLATIDDLTGAELFYVVRDGVSYKVDLATLAQAIKTAETIIPTNLPYRGARAVRTTDLTGVSFPVVVPWQSANFDTDGFFNPADPTKLVIPAGVSKVRLYAGVRVTSNTAAGSVVIGIRKNQTGTGAGTDIYNARTAIRNGTVGYNDNNVSTVTGVVDVVEGDYFDLRVNNNITGVDGIVTTATDTFFEIEVLEVTGV